MKGLLRTIAMFATTLLGVALANAEDATEKVQGGIIEFKNTTHNFGTFPEENGRVTCQFVFVNKGTTDVTLQKVRASCGCTTPDWTKTPVAPGDSGVVNATYNASGRPGAFTKTITVTSNAGEQRLTIKGEVIPKAKKIEDEYPFSIGSLRLKNQNIYLHKITNPGSKTEKMKIYNNSDKEMTVSFKNVPAYMTVVCSAEKIQPKKDAELIITYDSQKSNDWGAITATFNVLVNGQETAGNVINVNATIVEDFTSLTDAQKKNAPEIEIGSVINLKDVAKGKESKFTTSVGNKGNDPLIVRRVYSTDETVSGIAPKKPIKKGKSGDITFTINTKNMKEGEFTKRLTIISNDPNNSTKTVTVKGVIK